MVAIATKIRHTPGSYVAIPTIDRNGCEHAVAAAGHRDPRRPNARAEPSAGARAAAVVPDQATALGHRRGAVRGDRQVQGDPAAPPEAEAVRLERDHPGIAGRLRA